MQHISHTIRQESLNAYLYPSNQPRFGRQATVIYKYLLGHPGVSRNELSILLNIKINAVCGRVNELIKAKWIVEVDKKIDPYTKMKVNSLRGKE